VSMGFGVPAAKGKRVKPKKKRKRERKIHAPLFALPVLCPIEDHRKVIKALKTLDKIII